VDCKKNESVNQWLANETGAMATASLRSDDKAVTKAFAVQGAIIDC